jgi:hypothetical protein
MFPSFKIAKLPFLKEGSQLFRISERAIQIFAGKLIKIALHTSYYQARI